MKEKKKSSRSNRKIIEESDDLSYGKQDDEKEDCDSLESNKASRTNRSRTRDRNQNNKTTPTKTSSKRPEKNKSKHRNKSSSQEQPPPDITESEPSIVPKKRGRKPKKRIKSSSEERPAPEVNESEPKKDPKKRGRPPKARVVEETETEKESETSMLMNTKKRPLPKKVIDTTESEYSQAAAKKGGLLKSQNRKKAKANSNEQNTGGSDQTFSPNQNNKSHQQVKSKNDTKNDETHRSHRSSTTLQIQMDIQQGKEDGENVMLNQDLALCKKKEPFLYEVLQQRQSLKFKYQKAAPVQQPEQKRKMVTFKNLKQMLAIETEVPESATTQAVPTPLVQTQYQQIEAGISVKVQRRWCDFTGYPSRYKHKNGMRYSIYQHCKDIDKMQKSKIDEILGLRNAAIILIK